MKAVSAHAGGRQQGGTSDAQNAALPVALEARASEHHLLGEMIASLGSAHTLDEVLGSLVRCVAGATSGSLTAIYLYDREEEALVLHCTSEPGQPLADGKVVAPGEGLVDQVGRVCQPVVLEERAKQDPRVKSLPTVGENQVQSFMATPILARGDHLVGVLTVQAERPHAFTGGRALIQQATILVAEFIERARLDEMLQRRDDLLMTFSALSQSLGSGLCLDDLLRSLADLTGRVMEADQCIVLLLDQAGGTLAVRGVFSARTAAPLQLEPVSLERQTLEALRTLSGPEEFSVLGLGAYALAYANPLEHAPYKTLLAVPLLRESELLGLLYCYYRGKRSPRPEDRLVLRTIASQASLALNRRQLLDLLTHKQLITGFLELLSHDPEGSEEVLRLYASSLGLNLDHPHCVALVEIRVEAEGEPVIDGAQGQGGSRPAIAERITGQLKGTLCGAYPRSIVCEQGNLLTCLINLSSDEELHLKGWLCDLHLQLSSEHAARLFIGLSHPCQVLGKYRVGFAEAGRALQIGYSINPQGGVVHYGDLALYRYLTTLTDDLQDYDQVIELLASYDHKRGKKRERLLDTLELYLQCYGNIGKAADKLRIHPHTVRQRLERVQEVTGVDVLGDDMTGLRLNLQVAILTYRRRPVPFKRPAE